MTTKITSGPHIRFEPIGEKKLQFPAANNKTYEIVMVRRRMGGKKSDWQEVDLSKLTDDEKDSLIQEAQKTLAVCNDLDSSPDELKTASSLILRFTQEPDFGPGIVASTVGRLIKRLAWHPKPNLLQEVTYKTSEDSKEKSFKLQLEKYPPQDQEKIFQETQPLASIIKQTTETHLATPYTKKLNKNNSSQESTAALETAVYDAGATSNKCAALSIAKIMIERGEEHGEVEVVAQKLVDESITKIEQNDEFTDIRRGPPLCGFYAILSAVQEYNTSHSQSPIVIENQTVQEVRQAYLEKIKQNKNEMLDLPFFLTLEKPTIILAKNNEEFEIRAFTRALLLQKPIDQLSLEDLKGVNIVLYVNDNHYQAVIPTNAEHLQAFKIALTRHEENLLQYVRDAMPSKGTDLTDKSRQELMSAISATIYFSPPTYEKVNAILKPLLNSLDLTSDESKNLSSSSNLGEYLLNLFKILQKKPRTFEV